MQFSLFSFTLAVGIIKDTIKQPKRRNNMNTDKIYAESIAKEYAPKDKSKIIALNLYTSYLLFNLYVL